LNAFRNRLQLILRSGLSKPETRGSRSQYRDGGKAKVHAGYQTAIAQLVNRALCCLTLSNFRASVIILLQHSSSPPPPPPPRVHRCRHGSFVYSRNQCCRAKAISITYSECVCSGSYPVRNAQGQFYRIFSNLIRTSFCRFLKRKKMLVRGSNPHLSFKRPLPTRQTD